MFWQAAFFSAANSAMAFHALALNRPASAIVCIGASALGCIAATFMRRRISQSV